MDDNMNMNNDGFNETNTNETTNTYDNYRPAEPVNEAPAAEVTVEAPAADTAPTVNQTVSWQGSSYSGTPAQDSAYSTYQSANAYSAYSSYYTNAQAAQNNTQAAARNTAQNDAYAQYAAGYGYVPGGSGPVQRPYTASVIPDAPKKEKKQRHMPGFLKVILAAALFGIVAAGVFMLTNELYYRINPSASPSSTASSGTIGGHASRTSKTTDANLVASTALITDINSAATDVSPVVESAMPSIVSIDCTFLNTSFFGTYESAGAGSGILLKKTDDELLIATNNHVVANSTSINVTFCDGSTASAVIKGTDAAADLAVISV
ncbi:MAG: hypothetical protein IKX80_03935, partial [Lachnospiraceae bacterium]|nr:hypothetical protein [Lachnospiraceae bacterium]